jgi:hypothetical protein
MKKSKFIEDEVRLQYKKSLREFNQKINPKPNEAEREKLRQAYLDRRKK